MVVLAAITVETRELIWANVGLFNFKRSMAMRFNAVLSKTTTQSAFSANLFSVSTEL